MTNIELRKKAELGLYNPVKSAKEIRCRMLSVQELIGSLSATERKVLVSSTRDTIADIVPEEVDSKIGKLAKYITQDAGIKKVDDYELTRFRQILRSYYGRYTLQEVRLAFELAMIGELDEYLQKDRNGNPDKNHYQSFSVDYVVKILNAYKVFRNEVLFKCSMIKTTEKKVSREEVDKYRKNTINNLRQYYLLYKYKGVIYDRINEQIIYTWLDRMGLAEEVITTREDMSDAVNRMIRKSRDGLIGSFIGQCVSRLREQHYSVPDEAFIIARSRAIRRSFDYIIENEIQFIDLL